MGRSLMKKFLVVILSVLYISSSMGAGLDVHYCCGKLKNIELSFKNNSIKQNTKCGMKFTANNNGCCKDVHKQIKVSHDQNNVSAFTLPIASSSAVILPSVVEIPTIYLSTIAEGSFSPHSPPFREANPIYLKNCTFLI